MKIENNLRMNFNESIQLPRGDHVRVVNDVIFQFISSKEFIY